MHVRSKRFGWWPVVGVFACSAVARLWVARGVEAPWIFPDETTYALLGRSFWGAGSLSVPGGFTGGYSVLYPVVVGLPLSVLGPSSGLAAAQIVQALAMSSVALIVFTWGRRALGDRWALVAALLAVAIPGLSYTGTLMTETLFYPLATLALWMLWSVLANPSLLRQGLFVLTAALAIVTRVQALALLPAALLAVALFCAFRRDLAVARRCAPLLGFIVLAGAAAAGARVATGTLGDVVGVYAAATGGYELGAGAKYVLWHAGGVFVIVAGAPLIALGALAWECVRTRPSEATAALVATAFAWTAISTIEIGTFASRWAGDHIVERGLITLAPPLFLVLSLWLERGAPRPQPAFSVIALAVATPAILLPVSRLSTETAALDAFSFISLWRLREATSQGALEFAYVLSVGLVVLIAVFVPRRYASLVVASVVAATLVSLSVVSSHEIQRLSRADRTWVFAAADPSWIDEAADGPVTYVYADTAFPKSLLKTLFWNERIVRVLRFDGTPPAAPIPTTPVAPRVGGLILGTNGAQFGAGDVVAPSDIVLAGTERASYGPATDMPGMTLWRIQAPLRIRWITTGVQWNGDIAERARIQVPACGRGHLSLTLLGKDGAPARISVDGGEALTVPLAPGSMWSGTVPAPKTADGKSACTFELESTGLIGSTRIEFGPLSPRTP